MKETTNEVVRDIHSQVTTSSGATTKTVNELIRDIRDAVANGVMSESDVRAIISEIVGQAPEALDTLEEVAEALSGIYTKSQVDSILSDYYTKTQIDTTINSRVNKDVIAPTYDDSSAYAVGDYVFYGDVLYRCNTAIGSSGESWNATHWTAVIVTNGIDGQGGLTPEQIALIENAQWKSEESVEFFNETVSLDGGFGTLSYSDPITADTLYVTFNGAEYTCPRIETYFGSNAYGGFASSRVDYSEFPFVIMSPDPSSGNNMIGTNQSSCVISATGNVVTYEDAFEQGVKKLSDVPEYIKDYVNQNSGKKSTGVSEGWSTHASGQYSHAEGSGSYASGECSHAEGVSTTASGINSHAEGHTTTASGYISHAEGIGTIAKNAYQHASGAYNIQDSSSSGSSNRGKYIEIVGNGTGSSARSNARTLDWSGNEWLAGNLTLGGGSANQTTLTASKLKEIIQNGGGSSSGADNVLIVPLTYHPEVTGTIEDTNDYKGVWNSAQTYNKNDVVKHAYNNGHGAFVEKYKGEWDSEVSYSIGDIIYYHYVEDAAQNPNYKGEYDSSTTYNANDVVLYNDGYYVAYDEVTGSEPDSYNGWGTYQPNEDEIYRTSVTDNNLNHNPYSDDGTYWEEGDYDNIDTYKHYQGVWDSTQTYNTDDVVKVYNSDFGIYYYYSSNEDDNINYEVTNETYWSFIDPTNYNISYWRCKDDNVTSEPQSWDNWRKEIIEVAVFPAYYSSTVTYSEVKTAYDNNKVVIGKGSDGKIFILSSASTVSNTTALSFFGGVNYITGNTSDLTDGLYLNIDTNSNIFIIPLTYYQALSIDELDTFKGVWKDDVTYNVGDIVKQPHISDVNINYINKYKGAWEDDVTYNQDDVVSFSVNINPEAPEGEWEFEKHYYISFNNDNLNHSPESAFRGNDEYWWDCTPEGIDGSDAISVAQYFEKYKGEWTSGTEYANGDVVSYLNQDYNIVYYYTMWDSESQETDTSPDESAWAWDIIGPDIDYWNYYKCKVSCTGEDPQMDSEIYWLYHNPEGQPEHYTSTVTYNDLRDAIKNNKIIIAVNKDDAMFNYSDYIYGNTSYYYLEKARYGDLSEGSYDWYGTDFTFASLDCSEKLTARTLDKNPNQTLDFSVERNEDNKLQLISEWLGINNIFQFNEHTYYYTGEMVIHDGSIYKANKEVDSKDWDDEDWDLYRYYDYSNLITTYGNYLNAIIEEYSEYRPYNAGDIAYYNDNIQICNHNLDYNHGEFNQDDWYSYGQNLMNIISDNRQRIEDAAHIKAIATPYDAQSNGYKIGDYAIAPNTNIYNDGRLVRAKQNISSAPGDYNDNDWMPTNVGIDLASVINAIAPYYSTDNTYNVGDIVWKDISDNNVFSSGIALYKCITAVTTPEDFDDNKWEQTYISELLK